jgi:hypothetical protein
LPSLFPLQWLQESVKIAALCTFSLIELRYEYLDEIRGGAGNPNTAISGHTAT